jgi:hypothetical protein
MDLDQQRIKGAGRAAGVIGQLFMAKHTDRLAAHLAKVMRERPTPRKRTPMSLTPEVFDALRGIPKATIAAAMLRGGGLPQTTAVVAVRGPEQARQTGARRSALEPRRDQLLQWPPRDCAGMSSGSAMAVLGVASCTWRLSTRRP